MKSHMSFKASTFNVREANIAYANRLDPCQPPRNWVAGLRSNLFSTHTSIYHKKTSRFSRFEQHMALKSNFRKKSEHSKGCRLSVIRLYVYRKVKGTFNRIALSLQKFWSGRYFENNFLLNSKCYTHKVWVYFIDFMAWHQSYLVSIFN